jgi:hypothetical protein
VSEKLFCIKTRQTQLFMSTRKKNFLQNNKNNENNQSGLKFRKNLLKSVSKISLFLFYYFWRLKFDCSDKIKLNKFS